MHCMIMQARVKAIAEIVSELIAGVKEGRDVDLNNVKREVIPISCLHSQWQVYIWQTAGGISCIDALPDEHQLAKLQPSPRHS